MCSQFMVCLSWFDLRFHSCIWRSWAMRHDTLAQLVQLTQHARSVANMDSAVRSWFDLLLQWGCESPSDRRSELAQFFVTNEFFSTQQLHGADHPRKWLHAEWLTDVELDFIWSSISKLSRHASLRLCLCRYLCVLTQGNDSVVLR